VGKEKTGKKKGMPWHHRKGGYTAGETWCSCFLIVYRTGTVFLWSVAVSDTRGEQNVGRGKSSSTDFKLSLENPKKKKKNREEEEKDGLERGISPKN